MKNANVFVDVDLTLIDANGKPFKCRTQNEECRMDSVGEELKGVESRKQFRVQSLAEMRNGISRTAAGIGDWRLTIAKSHLNAERRMRNAEWNQ